MIVWPVSSFVETRKVGSSSDSFAQRLAHLLLIRLRLRLDRDVDHGLREVHLLENDRIVFESQSVSPVRVFLSPTAADDVAA